MMSGSGSTTFALSLGAAAAEELKERFIRKFGSFCWINSAPL